MRKHIRIFLGGVLVVAPLAVTVYVVYTIGAWLDGVGRKAIEAIGLSGELVFPGLGAIVVIVGVYLVGLLMRLVVFQTGFRWVEALVGRMPGVKTIYESIRDLMKLFGGDAEQMGRVVQYTPPGTEVSVLGIMTNDNPAGIAEASDTRKVAVYLPYAYMFGGPTIYVSPEHIKDLNMSVDQALKIAATAHVGARAHTPHDDREPQMNADKHR